MTHREKLRHFDRLLEERGFSKANAKPPIFRLLWLLGVPVPPPYFLSFRQTMLGMGGGFFLLSLGVAGWPFSLVAAGLPLALRWSILVAASVAAGALFGVLLALWWRAQAEKLALVSWSDFPGEVASAERPG